MEKSIFFMSDDFVRHKIREKFTKKQGQNADKTIKNQDEIQSGLGPKFHYAFFSPPFWGPILIKKFF